jgi:hypothetical protein
VDAQATVETEGEGSGGLIEAAIEISRKRTQMMEQMRKALEGGDDQRALHLARALVGLGQVTVLTVAVQLPYLLDALFYA